MTSNILETKLRKLRKINNGQIRIIPRTICKLIEDAVPETVEAPAVDKIYNAGDNEDELLGNDLRDALIEVVTMRLESDSEALESLQEALYSVMNTISPSRQHKPNRTAFAGGNF